MLWKHCPRRSGPLRKPRSRGPTRRATPEGQAEQEEVIRKVREEFPPLAIDPDLAITRPRLRLQLTIDLRRLNRAVIAPRSN